MKIGQTTSSRLTNYKKRANKKFLLHTKYDWVGLYDNSESLFAINIAGTIFMYRKNAYLPRLN